MLGGIRRASRASRQRSAAVQVGIGDSLGRSRPLRCSGTIGTNGWLGHASPMNDESLERANAFLAAVAGKVAVGEVLAETPAEIGRELGFPDALTTARVMRALISRRRLEPLVGLVPAARRHAARAGGAWLGDRARHATVAPHAARRRASPAPTTSSAAPSSTSSSSWAPRTPRCAPSSATRGRSSARRAARATTPNATPARCGTGSPRSRTGPRWPRRTSARCSRPRRARAAKPDEPVGDAEMAAILGVLRAEEANGDAPSNGGAVVEVGEASVPDDARRGGRPRASRRAAPGGTPPRVRCPIP